MPDIVINPSLGKIDFFTVKGEQSVNSMVFVGSNMGIGTTVPSASLHINSTTAGATLLRTDGTNGTLFSVVDDLSDSLMSVNNSAGLPVLEVFTDDRIVAGQYGQNDFVVINNKVGIGTNNPLAKLHVTGSSSVPSAIFIGNVGIGTTSPASKLSIAGSSATNFKSLILRNGDGTVGSAVSIDFETSAGTIGDEAAMAARISGIRLGGGTTGGLVFATTDNGNLGERVRILNNGAVGIGTTSPSLISGYVGLNVVNAGYTQIKLQSNASSAGIEFKPSSGNSWELQANNSNQWFVFDRTQSVYRLIIDVNGNVGIGTTSPKQKLTIVGEISLRESDGYYWNAYYSSGFKYIGTGYAGYTIIDSTGAYTINTTNSSGTADAVASMVTRMYISSSGNVGIGTASPTRKLDVNGDGYFASTLYIADNTALNLGNTSQIYHNSARASTQFTGTSGANTMCIKDSDGNVGIGTTSPTQKLHVAGNTRINGIGAFGIAQSNWDSSIYGIEIGGVGNALWANAGSYIELNNNGYFDSGGWKYANSAASSRYELGVGAHYWFTAASGTAGNTLTWSEKMRLDNNGNVGIGTTSPSGILDVYGATSIFRNDSAGATTLYLRNWTSGGTTQMVFGVASGDDQSTTLSFASNIFSIGNYGDPGSEIRFGTRNNSTADIRVTINQDGNVGIGTTSPSGKLHVIGETITFKNGSDSQTTHLYIANAANTRAYNLQLNSAGTNLALWGYNSSNAWQNLVNFNYNGNVGIGTTVPSATLHLNSTTSGATLLRADGTSGTLFSVVDDLSDSLMSVNNSAGLPVLEVFADDRIVGGQYGQNDLVVVNNKVGIGTNNPLAKLHVTGSASVPAAVFMGNVGIGTTSFVYSNANRGDIEVYGSTDALISLRNDTANSYLQKSGNDFYFNNGGAGFIAISTNGSEKMRITSTGALLVGNTSAPNVGAATTVSGFAINGSGNDAYISHKIDSGPCAYFRRDGSDGIVLAFYKANSSPGTIAVTTTTTTYNTTSDYRLKENIQPLSSGLIRVNSLKPSVYNWKSDGSNGEGFLAHELAEVVPIAVTGEKDALNKDGTINPQSVDMSKVVPILVAAIQELSAKVKTLEAKVQILESK